MLLGQGGADSGGEVWRSVLVLFRSLRTQRESSRRAPAWPCRLRGPWRECSRASVTVWLRATFPAPRPSCTSSQMLCWRSCTALRSGQISWEQARSRRDVRPSPGMQQRARPTPEGGDVPYYSYGLAGYPLRVLRYVQMVPIASLGAEQFDERSSPWLVAEAYAADSAISTFDVRTRCLRNRATPRAPKSELVAAARRWTDSLHREQLVTRC